MLIVKRYQNKEKIVSAISKANKTVKEEEQLSKDKIDEADEILNHFFDDYYHKGEDEETETEEEGEAESADEKDIQVTFKEVLE